MEVSSQVDVPVSLPSGKYTRYIILQGSWVDPRVGLDAVEKWKIFAFGGNRTLILRPSGP
jgi:hypothetical protein